MLHDLGRMVCPRLIDELTLKPYRPMISASLVDYPETG